LGDRRAGERLLSGGFALAALAISFDAPTDKDGVTSSLIALQFRIKLFCVILVVD